MALSRWHGMHVWNSNTDHGRVSHSSTADQNKSPININARVQGPAACHSTMVPNEIRPIDSVLCCLPGSLPWWIRVYEGTQTEVYC